MHYFNIDLVLSVEGSIGAGSPVCVAYCSYASEEREHLQESEINHQENGDLEIENR